MQFEVRIEDDMYNINLNRRLSEVRLGESTCQVQWPSQSDSRVLMRVGKRIYRITDTDIRGNRVSFNLNGRHYTAEVKGENELLLQRLGLTAEIESTSGLITAPMPGKVLEIRVKEGDEIEEGETIVILEAMKMENELKSSINGTILSVAVTPSDTVEKNQILIEIKARG